MQLSKVGLALTELSEGLRLRAYRDTGGVLTIGYGHTGGVTEGQVITAETAETLLAHDLDYATRIVNTHALPCTQWQFDALVDFVFNVGPSQFLSSHLFKYHVAGEYDKAAAEFPKWKFDNGKVIPGLVTRRARERSLYSRQGLPTDHQRTDEPTHFESSTVYFGPEDLDQDAGQFLAALLGEASSTVPASDSKPAGCVSRVWEKLCNLQADLPERIS